MKRSSLLILVLALISCRDSAELLSPGEPQEGDVRSPYLAGVVPGRFIVTLAEGESFSSATALARQHGVSPDYVYSHALKGFAGEISEAARQGLLRDPRVLRIEPDGIARIVTTQAGATWGIDRIDQRTGLSSTYSYTSTGRGVTAYIVDTGLRFAHLEFGARAVSGFDAVDGGQADDCNGHGTHVAGTVGGATYGVAKDVALVGVRVLDCSGSGTWSGVIAGIDWVTGDHDPGENAVANMSLGGGANASVDAALRNSIADGVAYAVAAGNDSRDACRFSPARVGEAMTIGATGRNDRRPSWSNWGSCVDWFAPGVGITSAWHTSDTATNTISGTSMATPHTAGVAATYLATNPGSSPATVRAALHGNTTKGIVTSSKSAQNHLLFTNY